jgi:putative transposase
MPWRTGATVSDIRRAFLRDHAQGVPLAVLMSAYDIKKSAAYALLARARTMSIEEAVAIRSRAPVRRPTKHADVVTERVLALCERYEGFGPKKIAAKFCAQFDDVRPCVSSVASIMKAHGLTRPSTTTKFTHAPPKPRAAADAPNDVWAVDHKGKLKKSKTEPLTVVDVYSRKWLCCRPLTDKSYEDTRLAFEALFEENGLPRTIRVDAGQPWASTSGPLRLSQLSVWWMSLGINIEVVACPQDNGHVERLHRTIKEMDEYDVDVRRYFEAQRAFYNDERPHEGIGQRTPSELYVPSPRRAVARREVDYMNPAGLACDEVRSIVGNGDIHLGGGRVFISSALISYRVGLRATSSTSTFDVYLFEHRIGTIEDRCFKPIR